jgi:hypothetical protein
MVISINMDAKILRRKQDLFALLSKYQHAGAVSFLSPHLLPVPRLHQFGKTGYMALGDFHLDMPAVLAKVYRQWKIIPVGIV